jgi:glycine dehydrogenase
MPTAPAFAPRHIGPSDAEKSAMLAALGVKDLDALIDQVVPDSIRQRGNLSLPAPLTEEQALRRLRQLMDRNKVLRSFIGLGYHDTFTPPVIQRNILENPGWYTA